MAFPNGYGYRRKITIDNTKVSGGSNHSNFPVLISGVYNGRDAISHWKMNDNAATSTVVDDIENNSGDFKDSGGSINTSTGSVAGKIDTALEFDGADEYVEIPDSDDLDLTSAFTLSAWIKTSAQDTYIYIISKENNNVDNEGDGNPVYDMYLTSGKIRSTMRLADGTPAGNQYGTTDLRDGDWHFVTVTYDGTTLRVYADGVLEGSSASANCGVTPYPLDIGRRINSNGGDEFYFDGSIDEVRIHDYALGVNQIKEIYNSGVGTEDAISDFLLPDLRDTVNGGHVESSDGYDIIFTSDAAGNTQLDHEIEKYVAATGEIVMWVRIPTLLYNSDTVIYMWYGKSGASDPSTTATWNSNYKMVQHMKDATTSTILDSTDNDNDGAKKDVNEPAEADAKIAKGQHFDGSDDYITSPTILDNPPANGSISLIVKPDNDSEAEDKRFLVKINNETAGERGFIDLYWSASAGAGSRFITARKMLDAGVIALVSTTELTSASYLFITTTWGADGFKLFINGVLEDSNAATSSWANGTLRDFILGGYNWGGSIVQPFDGKIDEVRVSDVQRTADWQVTEYNNQNSPSTFYGIGGLNIGMVLSDNFSISDTINTKAIGMSQTDIMSLIDAGFTKVWTIVRSKSDSVTITDAEVKEVSIPKSDTVTITDLGEVKVIAIPKSDSVSITDSGETKEIGVPKGDTFGITDSGEIKTMTLVRSDNVIITDTGEAKAISKPLSDILAIVDTVAKQIGINPSDTVTITDNGEVKKYGMAQTDTLTITDAGYTYYVPGEKAVFFISKEDVLANTREDKPSVMVLETAATAVPGIKPVYDSSLKYDTSGLYYDKWYSESGDLTQGEKPKMTVTEKNVKINVSSDKATIKKISKQRC